MQAILELLVIVTSFCASFAQNIETRKTHSMYLRNGGNENPANHEDAAYAGYTFDVTLDGEIANILVGQPRSGKFNQIESPGALYYCSFKFLTDMDKLRTTVLPTTPSSSYDFTTNAETRASTTDFATNANDTSTKEDFGDITATTRPNTYSTVETTREMSDFSPPVCNKLQIFDWTNPTHRDFDHEDFADALGLTVARLKNNSHYAVCTSLRQRRCPNGESHTPGACYIGNPKLNDHWSFKQWKESGCYDGVVEVMFVVDGSGSIQTQNFEIVKNWLINVIGGLFRGYGETIRTQVLQYSNKDRRSKNIPIEKSKKFIIPYTLNELLTLEEISQKIRDMDYWNGLTYTHFALSRAMEVEFPASVNYRTSKKVVVVLTDGKANDGASLSTWYKNYKDNVTAIAVGVGDSILSELRTIANGDTGDDRVYTVERFDQLNDEIEGVLGDILSTAETEGTVTEKGTAEDLKSMQVGTSIASSEEGEIYVGAVGTYKEAGTVLKYDSFDSPNSDIPSYKQTEEHLPFRTSDSYIGYSTVVGYFDGKSSDYYIATGAPRYSLVGAVVVYKSNDSSSVLESRETLTLPKNRHQVAEYFGGSLLALDVSGDGKDDLFVGASLYFKETYDEGRVFVYISQPTNTTRTWEVEYEPLELYGDRMPGGRFGTTIASAGDINLDGYNDVVIGAPLAEKGRGAVYIYHGKNGGLETNFAQKILASALTDKTLKYFGQSIQGNVDIDNNSYPDIFVGAPRSDTVVILRSRPIANISATVEYTTPNIDLFECIRKQYANCTSLKLCFAAIGTSIEPVIGIKYNMILDAENTDYSQKRVYFSSTRDSDEMITIDTNKTNCFVHWISMKNSIDDFETSVAAKLEFNMHPSHTSKLFSSVRDLSQTNKLSTQIEFAKECAKEICRHDLAIDVKLILPAFNLSTENDKTKNFQDVLVIDSSTSSVPAILQVNMSNKAEKAFKTSINVTYISQISLSELGQRSSHPASVACIVEYGEPVDNGNGLKTQMYQYNSYENIVLSKSWCYFELNLITDDLKKNGTLGEIVVNVTAYTSSPSSQEIDSSDNSREISTGVIYRSDYLLRKESNNVDITVKNSTNVTTISSVKEIGNLTDDIEMDFRISGAGYSNIPLLDITLTWPSMTEAGDPLLYLYKYACYLDGSNIEDTTCKCDENKVNPFNLRVGDGNETGVVTTTPAIAPLRVSEIDCPSDASDNHACENLNCTVTDLEDSDQVIFVALFRLWTSSINYTEETNVILKSKLNVSTLQSPLIIDKNGERKTSKTEEVIITVKNAESIKSEGLSLELIIIIILSSCLGGHELLRVIAIFLWRIGFFESKYAALKKEEQEKADYEDDYVNVEEIKPSKNDYA